MKKWIGLLILLIASNAYAADIALTRVTTATTISSSTENTNQALIEGAVNNLDGDNINTSANLTFNNATINGGVELGDGTSDLVSVNGRWDTNLNPTTTGTYDLGSSSLDWDDLFVNKIDADDTVTIGRALDVNLAANYKVTIDGGLTDIGGGSYALANGDNDLGISGDLEVDTNTRLDGTLLLGGVTTSSKAIDITLANTTNDIALTVTQNDVTNNPNAVTITNTGTGDSLFINHDGASGQCIEIDAEQTSGNVILVNADAAPSTSQNLMQFSSNVADAAVGRTLLFLVNEHADADSTVCMGYRQDGADNIIENVDSATGARLTSAGVWTNASSTFDKKTNISEFNAQGYIEKLKNMKLYTYQKKAEVFGPPSKEVIEEISESSFNPGDHKQKKENGKYYKVKSKDFDTAHIENNNAPIYHGLILDEPTTPPELVVYDKSGVASGFDAQMGVDFLLCLNKELIERVEALESKQANAGFKFPVLAAIGVMGTIAFMKRKND